MTAALDSHSPPRHPYRAFIAAVAVLAFLGAWCAWSLPPGTVWEDHLQSGRLLLAGQVPANPTYPIWGFSFVAGLFDASLVWWQALFACGAVLLWFDTLNRGDGGRVGWRPGVAAAALCALAMAPWLAVAASYYSNSMPSILALLGLCLLWRAAEGQLGRALLVPAGLCFGAAANMRSEYILIGFLLAVLLAGYAGAAQPVRPARRAARALLFFGVVLASMLPWALYTKATVGEYRLSASNSGASAYLGLAQLPNNPWGVVFQDDWVDRLVQEKVGARTAPTMAGDAYLKQAFRDAVRAHPEAFAQRVLYGWRTMLLQGLYVPNLRLLLAADADDEAMLSLAAEHIKQRLHLNPNLYKVQELAGRGLTLDNLRPSHYAKLAAETVLRAAYGGLFVAGLALWLWRLARNRRLGFVDWAALAFLAHLFFVAGFIQTSPRHTTLVLPVLLAALLCQPRAQALRASSQNRSSAG